MGVNGCPLLGPVEKQIAVQWFGRYNVSYGPSVGLQIPSYFY